MGYSNQRKIINITDKKNNLQQERISMAKKISVVKKLQKSSKETNTVNKQKSGMNAALIIGLVLALVAVIIALLVSLLVGLILAVVALIITIIGAIIRAKSNRNVEIVPDGTNL
ncbi:MAG TPA: hypothetical protein PKN48_13720 [Bacteroidales bacterium]|nr:hypothetical protein [Bacteroidales bacterium]